MLLLTGLDRSFDVCNLKCAIEAIKIICETHSKSCVATFLTALHRSDKTIVRFFAILNYLNPSILILKKMPTKWRSHLRYNLDQYLSTEKYYRRLNKSQNTLKLTTVHKTVRMRIGLISITSPQI